MQIKNRWNAHKFPVVYEFVNPVNNVVPDASLTVRQLYNKYVTGTLSSFDLNKGNSQFGEEQDFDDIALSTAVNDLTDVDALEMLRAQINNRLRAVRKRAKSEPTKQEHSPESNKSVEELNPNPAQE